MSNLSATAAEGEEAKGKEAKGKAELESTTAAVLASEGTLKCKKRKKKKKEEEEEANAKETEMAELEVAAVPALEGKPKSKKKEAKAKERGMVEQEATTTAVSASEGTLKCKKKEEKPKETGMAEQEPTATVLASEGTPKCKRKKKEKAKETRMAEHEATPAVLALQGTPKCKRKKEKSKETGMTEQEPTAAVPASVGTPKCKKKDKEKAKETRIAEEPTAAVLASEGTPKCKRKDETAKETGMTEQEPTAAVSASEGTPKCKKKLKKKNNMQKQQDSPQALLGVVAVDKIVANKSRNGCVDGEGVSGDVDVSMDPINGEDPNFPEGKESPQALSGVVAVDKIVANKSGNGCSDAEGVSGDADVSMDPINGEDPNFPEGKDDEEKMESKAGEGNKNCSDNCSSLQESSVDRKRPTTRPKRKRKRGSSSKGPGFSSQDGDRAAKDSLDSSTNHDLSCICAPCLVQAHKEKVKNFYSPRGSLIRFQRKKLLILDLNGLLADINQDYQNAHLAHAKVRAKLVFRRPYCDDFLRFCFQNFELGIWSSRKKENVNSVVNILMRDLKQYLLFCWDMSKCTVTGCNTVDNKHKPLVLKELKKLWNKEEPNLPWEQGEFSPSNTLLVDDSPYKALCNPPHTAIFPHPYSYLNQRDDYSLGPGGDLCMYLERVAAADDVQVFVRDNPFGQPSITKSDPHWNFYVQIVDKVEKSLA